MLWSASVPSRDESTREEERTVRGEKRRGDERRGRGLERSSEERSGDERRGEESKERRAAAEGQSDRTKLQQTGKGTRTNVRAVRRLQGKRNDCTKQQRKELERSTTGAAAAAAAERVSTAAAVGSTPVAPFAAAIGSCIALT